jgi:hypothetical protein
VIIFICFSEDILFAQDSPLKEFGDGSLKFNLFESSDLRIDLKAIDQAKGAFGIDYKLNLSAPFLGKDRNSDMVKKGLRFDLNSQGFLTVKGQDNQLNSVITDANINFTHFIGKKNSATLDPLEELKMTDDEIIEITRQQAAKVSSPLWVFLDMHAKNESSQDFSSFDNAFGASLGLSTSILSTVIDFPFGLLRTSNNNNPRQLDLSLVYDYVTNLKETASEELRSKNSANRVSFNVEWETGIFKRERISFMYNSFYELDAPLKIKESGLDKNYFYQIKFSYPLSKSESQIRRTLSLKYSQGELPPDFTKGYVLGAGFSVEF